jgi:secreted PhoX family phosphatase
MHDAHHAPKATERTLTGDRTHMYAMTRRQLLARGAQAAGALGLGLLGGVLVAPAVRADGADDFGPLLPPNSDGVRLPEGFQSRIVAVSGRRVASTDYTWHEAPDGGATFATDDGGWIYVSNSELAFFRGGVGAIRFDREGTIVDAYSILHRTTRNCAGGPTPWNTWLSCEETGNGYVYECDPFTPGSQGVARPAMGVFNHEAAAVDPIAKTVYLTEDRPDGLLYRFTPADYPDLSSGKLEAAVVEGGGAIAPGETRTLSWRPVPDHSFWQADSREQVPDATRFNGGEGAWYEAGVVFFSTKGDNRVWKITTATQQLEIVYDLATQASPVLNNVDNVFAAPGGDVYVAEDPGQLQIVALTRTGQVKPMVQVVGHPGSEITGPALSPDGTRLYFSSQRSPGTTFEVTGPFLAQTEERQPT